MQKFLLLLGFILILAGLFWPLVERSGLGRLPGDILIERENFTFYLPITTSILVSLALSILIWLFRR